MNTNNRPNFKYLILAGPPVKGPVFLPQKSLFYMCYVIGSRLKDLGNNGIDIEFVHPAGYVVPTNFEDMLGDVLSTSEENQNVDYRPKGAVGARIPMGNALLFTVASTVNRGDINIHIHAEKNGSD